jgi:Macrocin-O-methyltransferase (TylF)
VKSLGGGRMVLFPADCTGRRMTQKRGAALVPLLECQPYIHSAEWKEYPEGINLDHWRNFYRDHLNLADMVADTFHMPHFPREQPWLIVPDVKQLAPVVMHRSFRYQNRSFPWHRAARKYKNDTVFIGLQEEHDAFCRDTGVDVPFYKVKDMLEMAEIIAGGLIFMGNQSAPRSIAEGLKQVVLLEVGYPSNTHYARWGVVYGVDEYQFFPDLDQLEDMWAFNLTRRVDGYSIITPDRLKVIAKLARKACDLPGDIAEFGVFRGGSASLIADACPGKVLHLFDTFAGLPAGNGVHHAGEFAATFEDVRNYLAGKQCNFHPGLFPDTVQDLQDKQYAFVHVDADLYESTRDAIAYFWPRLVPDGAIVFDDVDWGSCPGVNQALAEAGLLDKVERTAVQHGVLYK